MAKKSPTQKQRKIAQLIVNNSTLDKPLNGGKMLAKVGYAKSMQDAKVNDVLESQGVKQALEDLGFTEDNAKMVVSEIMLNPKADNSSRLKATDQVFKVKGTYAPEKRINLTLEIPEELKQKASSAITQYLNDRRNTKQG